MNSENQIAGSSSLAENGRFGAVMKSLVQYHVPTHLLPAKEVGTSQDEEELSTRKADRDEYTDKKNDAHQSHSRAKQALKDFEQLLRAYNIAENLKNPSADQTQTIEDMNASIVDVTAEDGAGSLIARKIAAKSLQLKKARDDTHSSWDKACKVG